MNKSIWLEMATATTNGSVKNKCSAQCQAPQRGNVLGGILAVWVLSEGFFFLLSCLLRFVLHSSQLPVF